MGSHGLVITLGLAISLASQAMAQTAPSAAPPAQEVAPRSANTEDVGERVRVEGFRSARWGMTAADVKTAIRKDFNIPADKINAEANPAERTDVLTVNVPDLLEGAGTARVSYIFGFASKKLIQVNVLFGSSVDPQIAPDKIVAAANQLRQLFLDSGYQPETIVSNAKMGDGSILVFEGQDADKHTTVLRLASNAVVPASGRGGKEQKPVLTTTLSLSYVLDTRNPDIYRLKKGQF
jgi:hypothetical protein